VAEMTLPTKGWPDFQDGRVLTHNDLNRLRDYLYTKYAFQNSALFGFGVACGLGGSVDGKKLTISPGFALAGEGRELVLDTAFEYDLGDLAGEQLEEFDFVDGAKDGYTAVICAGDTPRAAGGVCDPDDCTLHTDYVDEGVRIAFARGQLKQEGVFAHKVFDLKPITPDKSGKAPGFAQLQKSLNGLLEPHLEAPTLKLLMGLELTGPAGVDLMKVGILNEVLYAAWGFFRCRAYGSLDCFGTGTPACVALGWISENGAWAWHCRHRHHFSLSRALYSAIRGSRCEDVCQVHLDHIRAILETFEPPPTKQEDPPKDWPDEDVHICTLLELRNRKCIWWKLPDLPYKVELPPVSGTLNPLDPIWNPPTIEELYRDPDLVVTNPLLDPVRPEETVLDIKLDPYGAGVLPTNQFLGFDGPQVAEAITKTLDGQGITASVEAVSMDTFQKTANLRPGLALAATDSIFLGTNAKGTVIAIGAVPTSAALGDMPGLRVDAQRAVGVAEQLTEDFGQIQNGFTQLGKDFTAIQTGFGDLEQAVKGIEPETLSQLPLVVEQLHQQVENTNAEVKEVGARLDRTAQMQTRRVDDTLNEALGKVIEGGMRVGVVGPTRAPLVRSIESLSTAIEAAAPAASKDDVRAALEEGRPALDVLRGGTPEEEVEGNAASAALESLLSAVRASGLSTDSTEYRRARREVSALQKLLELPGG
jgi:hypothetical protein